jgi:hypothetical protein
VTRFCGHGNKHLGCVNFTEFFFEYLRKSTADRLLGLRVRIPPGAWMFVCCECCVLSGRSLCDGLITRPEESYRLWCVLVCDLGTSRMRRLKLRKGCKCRIEDEAEELSVLRTLLRGVSLLISIQRNIRLPFSRSLLTLR